MTACDEAFGFFLHGFEIKGAVDFETNDRTRNLRGGCENEERDSGGLENPLEAIPGGGGDLPQFFFRAAADIEKNERKIGVAQEEISGAKGLLRVAAANPEQARQGGRTGALDIELIAAIDQGGPLIVTGALAEKRGHHGAGPGAASGTDEFDHSAFRKTASQRKVQRDKPSFEHARRA